MERGRQEGKSFGRPLFFRYREIMNVQIRTRQWLILLLLVAALVVNLVVFSYQGHVVRVSVVSLVEEGLREQVHAQEMEINAREMEGGLYRYLRGGDPADLEKFQHDVSDFRASLEGYSALAEGEAETRWAAEIEALIAHAQSQAEEIIALHHQQTTDFEVLQENFTALDTLLDESLQPARQEEAAYQTALLEMEINAKGMVLSVTSYLSNPATNFKDKFYDSQVDFATHLADFQTLGGEEQIWADDLETLFSHLTNQGEALLKSKDAEEEKFSAFTAALHQISEDLLDEKIQLEISANLTQTEKTLLSTLSSTLAISLVSALLIVIAASTLGVSQLRRVSKTFDRFLDTLERIEAGDLSLRMTVNGEDELGRISRTFNHMMGQIDYHQEELHRWGQTLEARVAEQTRDLQRTLDERDALYDIGLKLTSVQDLNPLLAEVRQQVSRLIPLDTFYIALYDEPVGELRFITYVDKGEEMAPFTMQMNDESLTSWIVRSGQPLFIQNLAEEQETLPVKAQFVGQHFDELAYIGLPLQIRGQTIGVISVQRWQPGSYDQGHQQLLAACANQVAIAIENARLYKSLIETAQTDPLTGLNNRRYFNARLGDEVTRAKRHGHYLSLVMLDLNDFKTINDTYGHSCGDMALLTITQALKENFRADDLPARWGGDEFVVLLPETSLEGARCAVSKLCEVVTELRIHCEEQSIKLSISAGVAALGEDIEDGEALLARADQAMYLEKMRYKSER